MPSTKSTVQIDEREGIIIRQQEYSSNYDETVRKLVSASVNISIDTSESEDQAAQQINERIELSCLSHSISRGNDALMGLQNRYVQLQFALARVEAEVDALVARQTELGRTVQDSRFMFV